MPIAYSITFRNVNMKSFFSFTLLFFLFALGAGNGAEKVFQKPLFSLALPFSLSRIQSSLNPNASPFFPAYILKEKRLAREEENRIEATLELRRIISASYACFQRPVIVLYRDLS